MYCVDLGNLLTKVSQRTTQSTQPLSDQTGQRLIPTSIRYGDFRNFGFQSSKSKSYFLFNYRSIQDMQPIYSFHSYLKKQLSLENSIVLTVPDTATPQLKFLYKCSLTPLYNLIQQFPAIICAISTFYFTYFTPQINITAQILNISESYSSNCVFQIKSGKVQVQQFKKSKICAMNFDQILAGIAGIGVEKNVFEIKKCRKVLSLNKSAVLNAIENDISVKQEQYLSAGYSTVNQLFSELACQNCLTECVGGASRDILVQNYLKNCNFDVKKRLNPDECFSSGGLLYSGMLASKTLHIDFLAQNSVDIRLSANGKDYSNLQVLEENVSRIPAEFDFSLQIQKNSHIQIISNQFILYVYEYLGNTGKLNLKLIADVNGEVNIQGDKIKQIFSYSEENIINQLVQTEEAESKQDAAYQ